MAVPKRKHSKSRKKKKRANKGLDMPNRSLCPQCGEVKPSHEVCPNCGTYKGRQIIEIKETN